jgi:hypothetical protein
MHKLLVYQAILGVFLCPYSCAVREAAARAPSEKSASASCCERCRTRQLAKNESPVRDRGPSDQDDPSEDGHSCLCEGVVFDATTRSAADSLLETSLWALAIDSAEMPELTRPDWLTRRTGQPPPTGGGWQVRIAVQSFLL